MKKRIFCLFVFMLALISPAFAHPGGMDDGRGHHDYENVSGLGSYHYHHGYSAHLHENGVCPYEEAQNPSDSEYNPWEDSSTDGYYEDAFNDGFEQYLSELADQCVQSGNGVPEDYFIQLREEWYEPGSTTLASQGCTYSDAFSDGYYTAEVIIFYGDYEDEIDPDSLSDEEYEEIFGEPREYEADSDDQGYYVQNDNEYQESSEPEHSEKPKLRLSELLVAVFLNAFAVGMPIACVVGALLYVACAFMNISIKEEAPTHFLVACMIALTMAFVAACLYNRTFQDPFTEENILISFAVSSAVFLFVVIFDRNK